MYCDCKSFRGDAGFATIPYLLEHFYINLVLYKFIDIHFILN